MESPRELCYKFTLKPILREEEKIKTLLTNEENALKKIFDTQFKSNQDKGKNQDESDRFASVLKLRIERRKRKLSEIQVKKVAVIWKDIESWYIMRVKNKSSKKSRRGKKNNAKFKLYENANEKESKWTSVEKTPKAENDDEKARGDVEVKSHSISINTKPPLQNCDKQIKDENLTKTNKNQNSSTTKKHVDTSCMSPCQRKQYWKAPREKTPAHKSFGQGVSCQIISDSEVGDEEITEDCKVAAHIVRGRNRTRSEPLEILKQSKKSSVVSQAIQSSSDNNGKKIQKPLKSILKNKNENKSYVITDRPSAETNTHLATELQQITIDDETKESSKVVSKKLEVKSSDLSIPSAVAVKSHKVHQMSGDGDKMVNLNTSPEKQIRDEKESNPDCNDDVSTSQVLTETSKTVAASKNNVGAWSGHYSMFSSPYGHTTDYSIWNSSDEQNSKSSWAVANPFDFKFEGGFVSNEMKKEQDDCANKKHQTPSDVTNTARVLPIQKVQPNNHYTVYQMTSVKYNATNKVNEIATEHLKNLLNVGKNKPQASKLHSNPNVQHRNTTQCWPQPNKCLTEMTRTSASSQQGRPHYWPTRLSPNTTQFSPSCLNIYFQQFPSNETRNVMNVNVGCSHNPPVETPPTGEINGPMYFPSADVEDLF